MIITHKISMDFVHPEELRRIEVVQGDCYTRVVEMSLYEDDAAWNVPEDACVSIRYRKADGTGGSYDTLPNGELAWSAEGNVLSVVLAPQMLTVAGCVQAQVELLSQEARLATFTFQLAVEPDAGAEVVESEDYVNWVGWMEDQLNQRMVETYNGATVYTKTVVFSSLPSNGRKSTDLDEGANCISCQGVVRSADGTSVYPLPMIGDDSVLMGRCGVDNSTVFVRTFTGLTGYQAIITVKYTK